MKEYPFPILNQPIDISRDFLRMENPAFLPALIKSFDRAKATGTMLWKRNAYKVRMAFNQESVNFEETGAWEFPDVYGGKEMELPFSISFLGPRTLRLRFTSLLHPRKPEPSLMLAREPKALKPWKTISQKGKTIYQGPFGSVTVEENPWHIEIKDASGKTLTKTQHPKDHRSFRNTDPIPFCFIRSTPEYARRFAATFHIAPDEKFFGCGESFTRLNKRGQKVVLFANDAHGTQTDNMYKPIPFFLSSRGYGMFLHTTAPTTFDFGHSYDAANTIFTGDDNLDLFIFLGNPKEVLSEYTALTGRSPVPPLWSFGLWMSRCTYKSEAETREVAGKLRQHRIPSDVVHLDTGWFEEDWRCDYRFSKKRFKNPRKMIQDLKKNGFRVSLWQLPYFTPENRLFPEIVKKGYCATDAKGGLPTEDATLDFSNPKAVKWYQGHLANLLKQGVAAIKVDFGEAAPVNAQYASGKTGFMEHNLYPLRYNKAAFDVTKAVTGDSIIPCTGAGTPRTRTTPWPPP